MMLSDILFTQDVRPPGAGPSELTVQCVVGQKGVDTIEVLPTGFVLVTGRGVRRLIGPAQVRYATVFVPVAALKDKPAEQVRSRA